MHNTLKGMMISFVRRRDYKLSVAAAAKTNPVIEHARYDPGPELF